MCMANNTLAGRMTCFQLVQRAEPNWREYTQGFLGRPACSDYPSNWTYNNQSGSSLVKLISLITWSTSCSDFSTLSQLFFQTSIHGRHVQRRLTKFPDHSSRVFKQNVSELSPHVSTQTEKWVNHDSIPKSCFSKPDLEVEPDINHQACSLPSWKSSPEFFTVDLRQFQFFNVHNDVPKSILQQNLLRLNCPGFTMTLQSWTVFVLAFVSSCLNNCYNMTLRALRA